MDKKKEPNHEISEEKKQQQKSDHSKPWLKLLPAAAVFAAVCVTCYQADKAPIQTVEVSDADIMSTADIKHMLTLEDSAENTQNSRTNSDKNSKKTSSKNSKKTSSTKKKASKIKTGTKKNTSTGAAANGGAGTGGSGAAGSTYTPTIQVPADGYVDGTYTGSGTGFGGTITVQVTVSNHKIASINIVNAASETASYFANAQGVISKILARQSPNVDAVSGATYSSNGIIQAVQNALSKAMPSGTQTAITPTLTPSPTPSPKPTKKPAPTPKPDKEQLYKDGTYTGTGKGYSGTVTLTAKIKKGVITSLEVKHTDTPMFFDKAWEVLEDEIIQNQTTDGIDTVSGATYSSKGILNAMKDILKQAKKGTAKPTPTPEPTATPTPEVTETPEVTPTPEETPTPTPEVIPEITSTPEETPEPTPEPLGPYRDGTYSGSSYGYSGKVTVIVTISSGQIVSLEQTNKDSPEFFDVAWGTLNPQILANQSADGIDTVSGATFSSEGILGAARKALAQAAV